MAKRLDIDFVSDVSCPWCVIGLGGLEQALERLKGEVEAEIRFQPFELDAALPPDGVNKVENLAKKYGSSREQIAANREAIKARAAALGFTMAQDDESRVYNTFDAHRLLHWAGTQGRQAALKHALFEAYFTHNRNPSDPEVLVQAAADAGLDPLGAREVLTSGRYADAVREAEESWRKAGITSVPAIVVNQRYLISGGQPPEVFEEALRQIAAEA
jgi:predicted DsbA family dithiol-disulfide isomerase